MSAELSSKLQTEPCATHETWEKHRNTPQSSVGKDFKSLRNSMTSLLSSPNASDVQGPKNAKCNQNRGIWGWEAKVAFLKNLHATSQESSSLLCPKDTFNAPYARPRSQVGMFAI